MYVTVFRREKGYLLWLFTIDWLLYHSLIQRLSLLHHFSQNIPFPRVDLSLLLYLSGMHNLRKGWGNELISLVFRWEIERSALLEGLLMLEGTSNHHEREYTS